MPALLTCRGLTLRRGRKRLIDGLSVSVSAGELLHVRGHNGVGKSTLLAALAGLLTPESGVVERPAEVGLAWLGHTPGLGRFETPSEALQMRAALHGQPRAAVAGALQQLGVAHLAHRPVGQLSDGQQRRVALAGTVLQAATLWILDEPLTALDAEGVGVVSSLLDAHRRSGGAAILTSHQALELPDVRELDLARGEAATA